MALKAFCVAGALKNRLAAEGKIEANELVIQELFLSSLTGFRTGGAAAVAFPETEKALIAFLSALRAENTPYYILGNGTNVLAKDEGYDGVVVCLTRLNDMKVEGTVLTAACGAGITAASSLAEKNALSGLEFCFGIPGTVGGAVFMNAGAYDGACGDVIRSVRAYMPDGAVKEFSVDELAFGYRTSAFQENGGVVLSATFTLRPGERSVIRAKMDELMRRRREKQPLEYPSCGSAFKRYPGRYTAQMIDEAGLRGKRIGGAMVSEKHAGFLINFDHASSADILALMDLVRNTIREREGVEIQPEIRILS